jgi:Family of unknown function (DUF6507)
VTAWDIDDVEASALISVTQGILDGLDGIEADLDTAVAELAEALGSRTVKNALQECNADFMRPMAVSAHLAGTRICNQTQEAVNAYVAGNNRMADAAQKRVDDLPEYTSTYDTTTTPNVTAS